MAVFTYYVGNRYVGDTTWLAQYYGAQTATQFELLDSSGALREVNVGTNFTYGYDGFFSTGTVNATYAFSADGTLTYHATGLNVDVSTRNSMLSVGTSGYDFIQYTTRGNDKMVGSAGDDRLYGSRGSDTIDGAGGTDVLTFNGFGQGVSVDLSTGRAVTGYGTSGIVRVEDVEGSAYGDRLTGNSLDNTLQGFGGNDTLSGGLGIDTASYQDADSAVTVHLGTGSASGGSGSDTLWSIERIVGSLYSDRLTGSGAAESFRGGFGNDTIDGAGGIDTVEYGFVGRGVAVDLAAGTSSGGAGNDLLLNVENAIGSQFDDTLVGTAAANQLTAGKGNDVLVGGAGADTLRADAGTDLLRGGAGTDVLYGGAGRDSFRFDAALASGADRIMDFIAADDTLQLENAVFTRFAATGAIAAGNFVANRTGVAADGNDYLVYETDTGKLSYDADGSGAGAAVQIALLGTNLGLAAADFVIV